MPGRVRDQWAGDGCQIRSRALSGTSHIMNRRCGAISHDGGQAKPYGTESLDVQALS